MKLRYNIIYKLISITLICFFCQCKKFIEIQPPTTQLVTADVFNNTSTATAAQITIYSEMFNNHESYAMSMNTGLLGDELTDFNTSPATRDFYLNAMQASLGPGPWVNAYKYIYQANAIMAALQNNSSVNLAIEKQLIGESEFVRAFWHFYLSNLYGDVPLVTNIDYSTNASLARSSKEQVYKQVVADLQSAQQALNSNYVDASDTTISRERTRPTKWAATALLARVYLYSGDYEDAVTQATAVINNTSFYHMCSSLDSVFLVNSAETIWQIATVLPSNYNTYDGYQFILKGAPGNSGACCSISPQLLNSFEIGDLRRSHWIDSFTTSGKTYYYPSKYKQYSSTTPTVEYTMVLRLTEQYLIRAEANAEQGNTTAAIADLNVIRNRAALQNYSGDNSKDSVLASIYHERQVELFTEWGHRWFDLIRTGNASSTMSVVTPEKGGVWNSDGSQLLYPIPQSEISSDVNLLQNTGY